MATALKSKTARSKLAPRRDPYYARLEAGLYVGYRVANTGDGTWIARQRGDDGKQQYHALGTFEHYDDAAKAAQAWATELQQGVTVFDTTVADACRAYVDDLKTRKSPKAAADPDGRFKRLVYGKKLAHVPLSKLQTRHLKDWLNAQVTEVDDDDLEAVRRSKDSANRNMASLKAALNLALRDRLVATNSGWATVQDFEKAGKRRERFLSLAERTALIKASPADLALLIKAMLFTAARPGELAGVTAQDFNRKQGTLTLSGKTGKRTVTLSSAAVQFFSEQAKNKIGAAHILCRADGGGAWTKDWWKKLFRKATEKAKLSDDVVLYTLRHAAISEMIAGGMDSFLVARLAGTSTAMIDQHYGHLRHDKTREKLDAVKLM